MVRDLAEARWHLQESCASPDVLAMLDHRIRDVIRDTECAACVELQLTKDLDKAVDRNGS